MSLTESWSLCYKKPQTVWKQSPNQTLSLPVQKTLLVSRLLIFFGSVLIARRSQQRSQTWISTLGCIWGGEEKKDSEHRGAWQFGWYYKKKKSIQAECSENSGLKIQPWRKSLQRNNEKGINKKKVINSSICSSLTLAFTPLHSNYPGKGTMLSPVTILRKIEMGKKDHQMLYCLRRFHIISWE